MGMKPDGRELLVVAVKGTFIIPKQGEDPRLAEAQEPLIEADTFTGEPGFSAPVYEVDYAPIKHRCDVLLIGSAYAPQGRPVSKVQVGLKVGSLTKTFYVLGERYWDAGVAISPGSPGLFDRMLISYDIAFGGLDNFHQDESKHSVYMPNPVGKGYHARLASELVDGTPMPNTEEINRLIRTPDGDYKPMAFGPIGRGWSPRLQYAGTYDQNWIDNISPFLPQDFNESYFQAAPPDQQIPYLKGGEDVFLVNLTPDVRCQFRLPDIKIPVVFYLKKGGKEEALAVIDTLVIEPDLQRFTVTWRVTRPLRKNIFEVSQISVARKGKERRRQYKKDVCSKHSLDPRQVVG